MYELDSLSRVFESAKQIPFDDFSRIVLMSDCHRGDGSWADDFSRNQHIYFAALTHYFFHDYNHSFRFAQGTKRNETVAFWLILFYNYNIAIAGNYKSRGGECAAPFGVDRMIICVDCSIKHK